jgi:hypothetical protein
MTVTSLSKTWVHGLVLLALGAIAAGTAAAAHAATPELGKAAHACALLSKAEVKKLAPWPDFLDQMQLQEDPLANGSGCSYPSAYIQVMAIGAAGFKGMLAGLDKSTLERITGVGDEAYLRDNKGNFAELIARVGEFVFTTQHSLNALQGRTMQVVKPEVIALGQALAAKLR